MAQTSNGYITIFCGSVLVETFKSTAIQLTELIYKSGYGLVLGGANVGFMELFTTTMLNLGGKVIGVVTPQVEELGVVYQGIPTYRTPNLDARVTKMLELSDGAITFPGGLGTLSEFNWLNVLTQFTSHRAPIKPHGLLNIDGYYDGMVAQIQRGVSAGFIPEKHAQQIFATSNPATLVNYIKNFISPKPDNTAWWNETKKAKLDEKLNENLWYTNAELPGIPRELLFFPKRSVTASTESPQDGNKAKILPR